MLVSAIYPVQKVAKKSISKSSAIKRPLLNRRLVGDTSVVDEEGKIAANVETLHRYEDCVRGRAEEMRRKKGLPAGISYRDFEVSLLLKYRH